MTTWIKYYRRDENYLNSAISYYDGGLLMGFILDMSLFKKGKRIEDKFREIPRRYTLQDLQRTFSDAEVDLGVVKSQSKEMLSMVKDFVTLEFLDRNKPYVGVTLENRVISFVEEGSPADVAGVSPRDEVLSVNDRPAESLQREISRCDEITLTLSREGRSMNLTLKVGRNPGHSVRVSSNDLSRTWAGKPFAVEVQSKVI
jgi:predicted metalloprotease with PDZ domain